MWIAFLDYYAAHFAFDRTVVQIRRLAERPRYPNERWSRRPIVLQDPFELERNLAGGLQDESKGNFRFSPGFLGEFFLALFASFGHFQHLN